MNANGLHLAVPVLRGLEAAHLPERTDGDLLRIGAYADVPRLASADDEISKSLLPRILQGVAGLAVRREDRVASCPDLHLCWSDAKESFALEDEEVLLLVRVPMKGPVPFSRWNLLKCTPIRSERPNAPSLR